MFNNELADIIQTKPKALTNLCLNQGIPFFVPHRAYSHYSAQLRSHLLYAGHYDTDDQ